MVHSASFKYINLHSELLATLKQRKDGLAISFHFKKCGTIKDFHLILSYSLFLNIFLFISVQKKLWTCLVRSKIQIQAERKRKKQRNLKENIQNENLTSPHRNLHFNFLSLEGQTLSFLLGLLAKEDSNFILVPVFTHLPVTPHFIPRMHFYKFTKSLSLDKHYHLQEEREALPLHNSHSFKNRYASAALWQSGF